MVQVHITGAGDFSLSGVTGLADPCPLPSVAKKRGLRDKEKLFYAPMSGLGDLLYDKDAVYININDHLVQFSKSEEDNDAPKKQGMARVYKLCIANTKLLIHSLWCLLLEFLDIHYAYSL
jgi:ribosome biogenesis protein BMS1